MMCSRSAPSSSRALLVELQGGGCLTHVGGEGLAREAMSSASPHVRYGGLELIEDLLSAQPGLMAMVVEMAEEEPEPKVRNRARAIVATAQHRESAWP